MNHRKLRPFRLLIDLDLIINFLVYLGGVILVVKLLFPKYEMSEFVFVAIMFGLILWQFPDEESVTASIQERMELIQDLRNFVSFKGFTSMLTIISIFIGMLIMFLMYVVFQSVIISIIIGTVISSSTIIAGTQAYKTDI